MYLNGTQHAVLNGLQSGDVETAIKAILDNRQAVRYTADRLPNSPKPFILSPFYLDTTQHDAFDYGTPAWRERFNKRGCRDKHYAKPYFLSTNYNLEVSCQARTGIICDEVQTPPEVFIRAIRPEIGRRNTNRCRFIRASGMRCTIYAKHDKETLCQNHIAFVANTKMNTSLVDVQSVKLQDKIKFHLANPNKLDLSTELAILRTMLSALLANINAQTSLNDVPLSSMAAILKVVNAIQSLSESIATIEVKMKERLPLTEVSNLLNTVVLKIAEITSPDPSQLLKIADYMDNIALGKEMVLRAPVTPEEVGSQTHSSDVTKYTPTAAINEGFTVKEVQEQRAITNEAVQKQLAAQKAYAISRSNAQITDEQIRDEEKLND